MKKKKKPVNLTCNNQVPSPPETVSVTTKIFSQPCSQQPLLSLYKLTTVLIYAPQMGTWKTNHGCLHQHDESQKQNGVILNNE